MTLRRAAALTAVALLAAAPAAAAAPWPRNLFVLAFPEGSGSGRLRAAMSDRRIDCAVQRVETDERCGAVHAVTLRRTGVLRIRTNACADAAARSARTRSGRLRRSARGSGAVAPV